VQVGINGEDGEMKTAHQWKIKEKNDGDVRINQFLLIFVLKEMMEYYINAMTNKQLLHDLAATEFDKIMEISQKMMMRMNGRISRIQIYS